MSCGDISAILISAVGILFSLITCCKTVNREKKILTIQEFSKIREKYPNMSSKYANNNERLEYLKEMERFCVGIHYKIYDIEIVKDMSGHLLVKQYDSYMKDLVQSRRELRSKFSAYEQYEETIKKIRKDLGERK